MDTKFSSSYWAHPQVEAAPLELKLAGAWMRTNERVTLFGYAAVTPRKFAFETGCKEQDFERALDALSEWFVRAPGGYFMPKFIGEQIGRGDSLLANYVCKPLVRALEGLNDPQISALVLQFYPELEDALKVASFTKPLASPSVGVRAEKSRVEQSRAEQSRGIGVQGEGSRPPKRKLTPGVLPADQEEPKRGRMLTLNQIFRRPPTDPWSAPEQLALEASGLLAMDEPTFIDAAETIRAFYHASIPREMEQKFWKRTTLAKLLENWSGELDKARVWARERDDGVRKVS